MSEEVIEKESTTFSIHRCVVCNGFGTLKYGTLICQACLGKGYIVINNETGLPVEEGEKDGRLDKTSPKIEK